MTNAPSPRRESDLDIRSETVLYEITRGRDDAECLRVTHTLAEKPDGTPVSWTSIRIWYRTNEGEWKPGRQGCTVRRGELAGVIAALQKANTGPGAPPATPARAPAPRRPEHRTSSMRQPSLPVAPPPSDGVDENEVF